MTFVTIFLGTDTQYTPSTPKKGYDNPETLSYVATLINPETQTRSADIHLSNNDVIVINGPSTTGSEVGNRIAQGVLAMLQAICREEHRICIAGHSRGAVEAILSSHELQRIKGECSNDSFSIDQILSSTCSLTNTGMKSFRASYQALDIGALKVNIARLKVSIFNIDPVPGGGIAGLGTWVAWRDERFYKIPSIVSSYYQIINENERTRCFKPIIPIILKTDNPKTQYTIESLPGHHGTACGNLRDQQRALPAEDGSDLVQKLTIAKLVKFLLEHEVAIKPRLDFFPDGCKPTPELFLDLYRQTHEKKSVFQRFNETSYRVLGQEQGIQRLIWSIPDQRIIHHGAHSDNTFHNAIFPPIEGFLNQQHAHMVLQHALQLTDNKPLVETFKTAIKRLREICGHASRASSPTREQDVTESMIVDADAARAVIKDVPQLNSIIDSLMEEINQTFLQNKFESPGERLALIQAIIDEYQLFKPLAEENDFARPIFNKLKGKLELTISQKQKRLTADYEQLRKKLAENHFMHELLGKINIIKNADTRSPLKELVEEIHINLQALNSDTLNVETVKKALANYKKQILELPPSETEDLQRNTSLLLEILGNSEDTIENYTAASIFQQLKNIDEQHKQLKETVLEFKKMDATLDIGQNALDSLQQNQNFTIYLSAKYLIKNEDSLENYMVFLRNSPQLFVQIIGFYHGLKKTPSVTSKQFTAYFQQLTSIDKAAIVALNPANIGQIADFASKIAELIQANPTLTEQPGILPEQFTQLTEIINCLQATDIETEAQHLKVLTKLRILTKSYLEDLINDVNQTFDVNLSINDINQTFDVNPSIHEKPLVPGTENPADMQLKNNLKAKFEQVVKLYQTLHQQRPPSLITTQFYAQLTEANELLKKHHTPDWQRYFKNALTILAVILTGIIPGVIVLACNQFSMFSNPNQRFINQTEKILPLPLRMNA